LFSVKRPYLRSSILFFVLLVVSFLLAGCAGQISNQNWPGLSADESAVYLAYGPGVLAYDVTSQEQLWSYTTDNATLQFFAPPSVKDGRVVIGDYGATGGFFSPKSIISIYGLETVDQRAVTELWMRDNLAEDRIVAAPLQVGDTAYVATGDSLVLALDAATGEERWRFEADFGIWAQPTYHDEILYVAALDRNLYALNAQSGDLLWETELSGAMAAKPVIMHALDLDSGDEVWTAEAQDWIWSAPALADGVLHYADSSGNVFAVDAVTGEPVWQSDIRQMNEVEGVVLGTPAEIKGAVQASPLVVDGVIYIASVGNEESGEGLLVALDAQTGEEIWQRTTPAPLFTTPAVVADTVVVALQSETAVLLGYDLETGAQEWSYLPPTE